MNKCIFDNEEYPAFVKNLQRTQYCFGYSGEWYNNWIDWIADLPYDEAASIINLINEVYITGVEGSFQ